MLFGCGAVMTCRDGPGRHAWGSLVKCLVAHAAVAYHDAYFGIVQRGKELLAREIGGNQRQAFWIRVRQKH